MKRPRRRNPVATALYLNAGLLGAVLVALVARGGGFGSTSTANAAPQPNPPAIGVVGNLALMPAQFSSNTWGCYVLDADKRTLCAYQYLPGVNQLRMVAARNFAQDLDLKNWNTGPDVREILRLTELERNGVRGRPDAQPQPRFDPVAPDGTTRPAEPVAPPPPGDRPPELEPANPGEIEPARPGEPAGRGNPG